MLFLKKKNSDNISKDRESDTFVCLPTRTTFVGNLETARPVRIECEFKGDIVTSRRIVLTNSAKVEGNITCESALISGEVKGDIVAHDNLVLNKPAHIRGNILTRKIHIEQGVFVEGMYKIIEDNKGGS